MRVHVETSVYNARNHAGFHHWSKERLVVAIPAMAISHDTGLHAA